MALTTVNNDVLGSNLTIQGNITSANIVATKYFIGDGGLLSNVNATQITTLGNLNTLTVANTATVYGNLNAVTGVYTNNYYLSLIHI